MGHGQWRRKASISPFPPVARQHDAGEGSRLASRDVGSPRRWPVGDRFVPSVGGVGPWARWVHGPAAPRSMGTYSCESYLQANGRHNGPRQASAPTGSCSIRRGWSLLGRCYPTLYPHGKTGRNTAGRKGSVDGRLEHEPLICSGRRTGVARLLLHEPPTTPWRGRYSASMDILPIITLMIGFGLSFLAETYRASQARRNAVRDALRNERAVAYRDFIAAAHNTGHRLQLAAAGYTPAATGPERDEDLIMLDSTVVPTLLVLQILASGDVLASATEMRQALCDVRSSAIRPQFRVPRVSIHVRPISDGSGGIRQEGTRRQRPDDRVGSSGPRRGDVVPAGHPTRPVALGHWRYATTSRRRTRRLSMSAKKPAAEAGFVLREWRRRPDSNR